MQLQCCHVLNAVQIWCVYVCEWREAKKLNHSQFCGMGSHFFWSVWRRRAVIRQKESVHYDHAIPPTSQRKIKKRDMTISSPLSSLVVFPRAGLCREDRTAGAWSWKTGPRSQSPPSVRHSLPSWCGTWWRAGSMPGCFSGAGTEEPITIFQFILSSHHVTFG